MLQKVTKLGVGGCILEVLFGLLGCCKQFERVANYIFRRLSNINVFTIELSSFVRFQPGTHPGNHLEPYMLADDLKILAIKADIITDQRDLNFVENWIGENKMKLAVE